MNFFAPFLILMMNTSKRTLGTLGFVAGLVIFGHWLDFYQMIKPGVWYNYEHKMHIMHEDAHGETHGHEHTINLKDAVDQPKAITVSDPDPDQHDHATHEGHDHAAHDGHDHAAHDGHDHAAHDGHDHAHHDVPAFVMGVHLPGFLEIGVFAGFLGLFLFVTLSSLSRVSLYPPNDPYILESETYDTGIGPERGEH